MTNGKIPTWFAVKWLTEHQMSRAEALSSDLHTVDNELRRVDSNEDYPCVDSYMEKLELRDDWTIVNAQGVPLSDSELSKCE